MTFRNLFTSKKSSRDSIPDCPDMQNYRIIIIYFLPKYLKTCFLYSVYSLPKTVSRYFSSCKICKCSIIIAKADEIPVNQFAYIKNTPMYIKSNPQKEVKSKDSLLKGTYKAVKTGNSYVGKSAKKKAVKSAKRAAKTQKEITKKAARQAAKQAKKVAQNLHKPQRTLPETFLLSTHQAAGIMLLSQQTSALVLWQDRGAIKS